MVNGPSHCEYILLVPVVKIFNTPVTGIEMSVVKLSLLVYSDILLIKCVEMLQ